MTRTRWQTLVLIAALTGVGAFFVLANVEARGGLGLPVPWASGLGPAALAVVLLVLGRGVKRLVAQEDTFMTPLGAARVVVLAKSSALVGSGLVGYFAAQLLLAVDNLGAPLPQQRALASGLALLASAGLVVAAMVVEHWCRVPPEDEDDDGPASGASAA